MKICVQKTLGMKLLLGLLLGLLIYYAVIPDPNGGEHISIRSNLIRTKPLPPFSKEWASILHFVPKQNNQDCRNLFTTESSKDIQITKEMIRMRAVLANQNLFVKFRLLFLTTPVNPKLTLTYQELARQDFVHTVCEIGFNMGQSAIAWLTAKPNLVLYSFDIGTLPLTKHMAHVLKAAYPDRFTLTIGDSRITVPEWAKNGKKCDIVSIDGSHYYPWTFPDFVNMKQIAANRHIIIADDIYFRGVNDAWLELVAAGYVHHLFDCWIHGIDIDFAIGYYLERNPDTI